jgi:hypothetical protein
MCANGGRNVGGAGKTPGDFFLFVYLKVRLRWESFEEEGELAAAIRNSMHSISREMLASVFAARVRRLQLCVELDGEYAEQILQDGFICIGFGPMFTGNPGI